MNAPASNIVPAEVSKLLSLGFYLFPCVGKQPALPGDWHAHSTNDAATITGRLALGHNLAIDCAKSKIIGADVDTANDPKAGTWFFERMKAAGFSDEQIGRPYGFSRSGGPHYAIRVPDDWDAEGRMGIKKFRISDFRALTPDEKDKEVFSFRSKGYLVCAPSVVDGQPYRLNPDAPDEPLPWLPALGDVLPVQGTKTAEKTKANIQAPTHDAEVGLKNCTFEEVERAIGVLVPEHQFDDEWDWTQSIWRIKRSLGVAGWPLVETISYADDEGLRRKKWDYERPQIVDDYGALSLIKDAARVLKAAGKSDAVTSAAEERYDAAVGKQKGDDMMRKAAEALIAVGITGSMPLPPPLAPAAPEMPVPEKPKKAEQTETAVPRFVFETEDDLENHPDPTWLVEKWIPERSVGIFYGWCGTGKSFAAFDLLLHLAYGLKEWHGIKLPGIPCYGLLIAREGASGFKRRIKAFKKHHGITEKNDRLVDAAA
jgi:hypothetical protein